MRGKRIKVSNSYTLASEGESEQEHGEERENSTVKEGRFQGGEGGQARKAFLGDVEGSMSV